MLGGNKGSSTTSNLYDNNEGKSLGDMHLDYSGKPSQDFDPYLLSKNVDL
jgi:hypothetical protein